MGSKEHDWGICSLNEIHMIITKPENANERFTYNCFLQIGGPLYHMFVFWVFFFRTWARVPGPQIGAGLGPGSGLYSGSCIAPCWLEPANIHFCVDSGSPNRKTPDPTPFFMYLIVFWEFWCMYCICGELPIINQFVNCENSRFWI